MCALVPGNVGYVYGGEFERGQRSVERVRCLDAPASVRWDAREFPSGQGKRRPRALPVGAERNGGRRVVDRRQRWNLQDGKRKDRQSKRHLHHQRQGLGRYVEWETQGHVGFYDWPAESSRQSSSGKKTRRDISLEFRFDGEPDVGRRARLRACFGSEEIEVPLERAASVERDFKRLEVGIGSLEASAFLTVLDDSVVDLQLPLGSYHIIGAVTFEKQIAGNAKLPIVIRIVNQGRLWEDPFEAQLIGEKPDDSAAGGHAWILIDATTDADDGEDFVFLKRKCEERFPRHVDRIAGYITLKIRSGIDLDSRTGVIVHHIFQSQ